MYPDFLGIGAQKAGTTWLHDNLKEHPQIWMPPVKELHYLDHAQLSLRKRLFGRAMQLKTGRRHLLTTALSLNRPNGASDFAWALRYCLGRRDDDWYQSLFPRLEGKITGEICPGYCRLDANAVGVVRSKMPNAKIIYMLRNPVDRAWSTAVMHFNKKKFGGIDRFTRPEIRAHLSAPKTLAHSNYLRNLDAWERHFGDGQLFVGFFDELSISPRQLLQKVLVFLGVDHSNSAIASSVDERRNPGRGDPIPVEFQKLLSELHLDQIRELNRIFDNPYTKEWQQLAESHI